MMNWSREPKLLKYRKVKAKGKEGYQMVLEVTPFYAESGGQVGDTGVLITVNSEKIIAVTDTKKENDLIIHLQIPCRPRWRSNWQS